MEKTEIVSLFEVTDFKTGKMWAEAIDAYGQNAIKYLRTKYPRFTKFVLTGFEVDGTFVHVKMRR